MSTAATRMRRLRAREREGRMCVQVELDADDIETLIEAGLLRPQLDHFDREDLARAIKGYLRVGRYA